MEFILGTIVSIVVEGVKKYVGTDVFGTLLAVAILSLVAATFYTLYSETIWWQSMIQIAVVAGAIHNYLIRRF